MTSQVTDSGKHKREVSVCSMESTKDDSPLKTRFFEVRKEVYNRYKEKKQTEQQAVSAVDQSDCHGQIHQEALS